MFKWYGILGIFMVLFAQVNFVFKIQPFEIWYFPIIWFGFIFVIDAINFKLNNKSLIANNFKKFIFLVILSAAVWWGFEVVNYALGNWNYQMALTSRTAKLIFATLSFSTVIPAVFEVAELLKSIHIFDKVKLKKKHNISKTLIIVMIVLGIVTLILPIVFSKHFYYLIWVSFFFILDPINYLHKQPSIIQHLKDRKLLIPLALFIGGTICGVFWEFWNYWASQKWFYNIPYVGFAKVFEMPILGYLGYGPFAFELYAIYHFINSLFHHKKKDDVNKGNVTNGKGKKRKSQFKQGKKSNKKRKLKYGEKDII